MKTVLEEGHGHASYRAMKIAFRHGVDVSFCYNGDETIITLDKAQKYLRNQMLSIIGVERQGLRNMEAEIEERKSYILEQETEFKELFGEEPNIS
jgi:hypothetical protein